MKLFARLFARYAAHVGYLDGKRNFPGEQDFVEMPVHDLGPGSVHTAAAHAAALQTPEASGLKDRRQ